MSHKRQENAAATAAGSAFVAQMSTTSTGTTRTRASGRTRATEIAAPSVVG